MLNNIPKRKIYVVGGHVGYANWMKGEITNEMENADLVVFTGGEDVCPLLYGEKNIHPRTYYNLNRDYREIEAYEKALNLKKKMIGICRGHQFLSVMNGAKLIQHQHNPGNHKMTSYTKKEMTINSLHHQAVYPFLLPESKYHIVGHSQDISEIHQNGLSEEYEVPVEIEAIYFPETQCLGIQCHPEMMYTAGKFALDYIDSLEFFDRTLSLFLNQNLIFDLNYDRALKHLTHLV